jgi:hypothetical protein
MTKRTKILLAIGIDLIIVGVVLELINRFGIFGKVNNTTFFLIGAIIFVLGLVFFFTFLYRDTRQE